MPSRGKKLVELSKINEIAKGNSDENVTDRVVQNHRAPSNLMEQCLSGDSKVPKPSQGIFAFSPKCYDNVINTEEASNSSQLIDVTNVTELRCCADSIDAFCNLDESVSQPCTSFYSVENIPTTSRENSYAVIRTDEMKLNLRKISIPKTHENYCLEDEDVFAEESSDYEPSESGNISSESNTSMQSNNGGNQQPPSKQGKRRTRNPEKWKKLKAKFLKNSGKCYQSRTGKLVRERVMGPSCSNRCKLSYLTKVNNDVRAKLFEEYWKLASLQRQRDFLGSCIEPLNLKYRRIFSSNTEPRRQNCAFFLLSDGKRIRVCKPFIIATFGITERTIRTVIKSKASGTGIIEEDKRGRHGNQKKTDSDILNCVRNHINSIPRVESHYLRANTTREFVDGGLCIAEMFRNYQKIQNDANKVAANYETYARIFNNEFNIGFFAPRKDQCDVCEAYKNATATEKEHLESAYHLHQTEKKLSRDEKARDKKIACENGSNMVVATYDLQAVLPVPIGQTSAFFYKSRLNCYNLTISEIQSDHNVCYFWHEGLGHRGANEIGSCVLLFLEELASTRDNTDVVFYTDNCGGQQKNRFIIGMYLYAVEKFQVKSITHKFLIRGHTQNEGDAVHSTIEKSIKKAKKSGPIYVPDQYVSLIRSAKKKGNPFIVKEMSFGDFMDLKLLSDEMAFNHSKNVNGDQIKLSDIKMMRFEKGNDYYFYKTSYDDSSWRRVQIKTISRRSSGARGIKNICLKPAYNSKLPISTNKTADIQSLMNSYIIPRFYEPFFSTYF